MFIRRRLDKFILPLLAAGVFIYLSYQPIFRLSTKMPAEFADATGSAQQRAAEAKIAGAYWDSLVRSVQWKYGYGYYLPQEPPAEFTVNRPDLGASATDATTRVRYWRKAQQIWYVPGVWQKEYVWDFAWMTSWIQSGANWIYRQWERLDHEW